MSLFTLEGHSEFVIRNSDFLRLDEERELGLSGHMRAKDEALTLRQSVMSCIDALDELILTVQPSSDNTVQIASELAQKYDKIRLFVYLPDVVPFSGSHVKSSDVPFPPGNSVHSYAHYSNFGLVRIRYKYYIKLDSDQIYFTQKLKSVRAAILGADMYQKKKKTPPYFAKLFAGSSRLSRAGCTGRWGLGSSASSSYLSTRAPLSACVA